MTTKGLVQETAIFAVLVTALAIFTIILGADASGDIKPIFEILESSATLLAVFIPILGFYFFYQAYSS